jgi:hypothetical protein
VKVSRAASKKQSPAPSRTGSPPSAASQQVPESTAPILMCSCTKKRSAQMPAASSPLSAPVRTFSEVKTSERGSEEEALVTT